jgi:chromosomal replication initiator protein
LEGRIRKTHLAHAIGVEIKDKYPEKTVLYISAEISHNNILTRLRKKPKRFHSFYQLIDVLIIDDVQFLSGKSGTQDVFSIFSIICIKMENR